MLIRSLSDREILSRIQRLTRRERSLTLAVLLHLNEIERRRLHLKLGHSSMFDYCTVGLGYSASAATRRIRTARCVARFPGVYALLKSNDVNLSTVSQVSGILNAGNVSTVLERIRGKSQRHVEAVVAEYEPRSAMPRESVRTIVVSPEFANTSPTAGPDQNHDRSGCDRPNPEPALQTAPALGSPAEHDRSGRELPGPPKPAEKRFVLQFSASEAFMAKLERVRSLAWYRLPVNASLEQVFEFALDSLIEREDPYQRRERRAQRASNARSRESSGTVKNAARPCHIPASVRDEIFARDHGQCSFVGSGGKRCESRRAIQIDHIAPRARGGSSTPGNLRLLCAYHNRLEAERILGTAGRPPSNTPWARSTPGA